MTDYYDEASRASGETVSTGLGTSFNAFKTKYGSNNQVQSPVSAAVAPKVQYSSFINKQQAAASPWDIKSTPSGSAGLYSPDGSVTPVGGENPDTGGFGLDGASLQGYAQLGGLAMELIGYSDKKKFLKAQTQGLQQNIAQQKVDNDFRATARGNLNAPMAGANTGIA